MTDYEVNSRNETHGIAPAQLLNGTHHQSDSKVLRRKHSSVGMLSNFVLSKTDEYTDAGSGLTVWMPTLPSSNLELLTTTEYSIWKQKSL